VGPVSSTRVCLWGRHHQQPHQRPVCTTCNPNAEYRFLQRGPHAGSALQPESPASRRSSNARGQPQCPSKEEAGEKGKPRKRSRAAHKRAARNRRRWKSATRQVKFSSPLETPWGVHGRPATAAATSLCSHALPPRTEAEALSRPDADQWQQAIEDEVKSCLEFGAWEPADLPEGKQALPSRFVVVRKHDGRYKARLVAGHRQNEPTPASSRVSILTIRLLLCAPTGLCVCYLLLQLGRGWYYVSLTFAQPSLIVSCKRWCSSRPQQGLSIWQEAMGGCCSFGVLCKGCAKHHGPGISVEIDGF
jgi:hypothetical protein